MAARSAGTAPAHDRTTTCTVRVTSLSVLIPTLNAIQLLPGHLRSMEPWLDLAGEIIVVDSDSDDGTCEFLRAALAGKPVRFLSHPRGLYQSWNHGISQAVGRWLYISTVGDPVQRPFLEELLSVAKSADADVVLGSPAFIDEQDQPLPPLPWSVNDIAAHLSPDGPCLLSWEACLFYALKHLRTSALLGSSASNLYRTRHLQTHPFPTDYGMAGDAAWGFKHALDTRFAFTPRAGSFFRLHQKSYAPDPLKADALTQKLDSLCTETCRLHQSPTLSSFRLPELGRLQNQHHELLATFKQERAASSLPWYLRPSLWTLRSQKKQTQRQLGALIAANDTLVRSQHITPLAPR